YTWAGIYLSLGAPYWIGWAMAVGCAVYHFTLIRGRKPESCFAAFRHNNWLGGLLFSGVALSYLFRD
ncbi:4-hydroxybenzoate polyprenyltransferase, partial [Paraburkholderia sp. MM6662-R1]